MSEKSIEVLLIEGNPDHARRVQEMLDVADAPEIMLTHVDHLGRALEHLKSRRSDLLLVEMFLPDESGLGTLGRIRDAAPEIPIIVFTEFVDESCGDEVVRIIAADYLLKGEVDGRALVRSIRRVLGRDHETVILPKVDDRFLEEHSAQVLEAARKAIISEEPPGAKGSGDSKPQPASRPAPSPSRQPCAREERRKYPRFALDEVTAMVTLGGFLRVLGLGKGKNVSPVIELSEGGVRLVTQARIVPKTRIHLKIEIPKYRDVIECAGEVRWSLPSAKKTGEFYTAAMFVGLPPPDAKKIAVMRSYFTSPEYKAAYAARLRERRKSEGFFLK